MKALMTLALASAWSRRLSLGIVVLGIAVSSCLLLLIERVRQDVRHSFNASIVGVDLVVGPRSGDIALLLQTVFHIGQVPHTLSWAAYERLGQDPAVAWRVPLMQGDHLRGFPVVGTEASYFQHLRQSDGQALQWREGRAFEGLFEAVIGHEVAQQLGLRVGQTVALSHGLAQQADHDHDHDHDDDRSQGQGLTQGHADKPLRIVGVLAPTGTPQDRTVWVDLQSLTALHLDWMGGAPIPGFRIPAEQVRKFNLQPKTLNAALVGLHQPQQVLAVQRRWNTQTGEALQAVMPGVALDALWALIAQFERSLQAISALVIAVGLGGMAGTLLAGLNERRREMAVLRALGASPHHWAGLLCLESLSVTALGLLLGVLSMHGLVWGLADWAVSAHGVRLAWRWPSTEEWALMGGVMATGWLCGLLPALKAWTMALSDGLMPRS